MPADLPLKTPLHALHLAAGARMAPFAGWDMPLHYGSQLDEHHAVRAGAGVFDVSHMAQADLHGPQAEPYLQRVLCGDVARIASGKALYTCLLNEQAGIIDDLLVYRLGADRFRLVLNAARREADLAWLRAQQAGFDVVLTPRDDLAMLAVQGPQARTLADPLLPAALRTGVAGLARFAAAEQGQWLVGRTGYTGEDGYEIMLPAAAAPALWQALLQAGVRPAGLGARDTLRLEAGMCLYGNDIDATTTPVSAAIGWAVAPARRAGGVRAGGFPGAAVILGEFAAPPARVRVGLLPEGRAPQRAGAAVVDADGRQIGVISSGNHSPTLGRPIAMAYIERAAKLAGTPLFIESRGQKVPAALAPMPFVPNRYRR